MDKEELIKGLVEKFNISSEEASNVLKANNWNIIEATIYLNNKYNNTQKKKIDLDLSKESENEYNKEGYSRKKASFSRVIGKFIRFICDLVEKGNKNYF